MSQETKINNFSEYKARREELVRAIDYNRLQISYHQSQISYLELEIESLDQQHQTKHDKLLEAKHIENKLSIQEVADMLAMDKKQVKDRVADRKAKALIETMMKGFK